ncbi:hypothetical protein PsYK624_055100 [Phanerochaete sordida]|uniref:Heterokaryon incompatibility domain-containing protein n=1 Tax=Phanerochaete sordida TaxID=48140 RepID=A0A9P3LCB8_9APHY|nr:hypothetical protein PsYK624_055100 [Phanerochaete sordida]
MSSSPSSPQDTVVARPFTGKRRRQDSVSEASTADSRTQAADMPGTAQSPQSRERPFVLKGTPIRMLGFDVPWDDDDGASEVQVSASLLKQPFARDRDPRKMDEFLAQKRRIAWGIVQIAQSGTATERTLFGSGSKRSFTLRPLTHSNIPLQWTHIGCGTIPNALADVLCEEMTAEGLLDHFNRVMGTNVSLDVPGLSDFLDAIRCTSPDFGVAYGKVRARWPGTRAWHQNPREALTMAITHQQEVDNRRRTLDKRRRECADAFSIGRSDTPPRRIWDLYSNRVLPYGTVYVPKPPNITQMLQSDFPDTLWTVSHSWVAAEAQENVWTPINGYQWPVPIPRATTLEHVRIELLNMGAEYVWLDVLCLRQQGRDEDEAVRLEEWKVDVPTIGYVYRESGTGNRPCATYFNGLGLPLDMAPDALASRTHWLNRVWTLQETLPSWIPCGLTGRRPPADSSIITLFSRHAELLHQIPNGHQRHHVPKGRRDMLMRELQKRSCTSELDRIAGLAYIAKCSTLPVYRAGADVEGAWQQLLKHASEMWRMDVMCKHPADAPFALFPSWDAYVSAGPAFRLSSSGRGLELINTESRSSEEPGRYCHWSKVLGPCKVIGKTAAQDGVQLRLEVRLDPGKSAKARTLTACGAHGVLLEGINYQLVIVDERYPLYSNLCAAVEVVGESEASKRGIRGVEAIKWAVLQFDWKGLNDFQPSPFRRTPLIEGNTWITYLAEDEALRRTSYKERYLKAFRVMTERKDTLIVSE